MPPGAITGCGTKRRCEKGNLEIEKFVKLAREAWYSSTPSQPTTHGIEWRKHPNSDRRFNLAEYGFNTGPRAGNGVREHGGHYTIAASELRSDHKVYEIRVFSFPDQTQPSLDARHHGDMLTTEIAQGQNVVNVSSSAEIFGEGYTQGEWAVRGAIRQMWYSHKCIDESVKVLAFDTVPNRRNQLLQVFLSQASEFLKNEGDQNVIKRIWDGFKRNEGGNHRAAFMFIFQLEKARYDKSALKPESFDGHDFYELCEGTDRYFRKASNNEIVEYQSRHQPNYIIYTEVARKRQHALSLRKKEIYGLNDDGSRHQSHSRF